MVATGFGGAPWGGSPWGAAMVASVFTIESAEAIRENVVRVTFNSPIYLSGLLDADDASPISHWAIHPIEGTTDLEGDPTRPVGVASVELAAEFGGSVVDLTTDRPFSSFGSQYLVAVAGVRDLSGRWIVGGAETFGGVYRETTSATPEKAMSNRDFANPQSLSGVTDPLPVTTDPQILGTYPVDDQGDYAYDEGIASLRKRIYRRIYTRKGSFAHLPTYGTILLDSIKQLARSGVRDALLSDVEEQIRQEPEVVNAAVRLQQSTDGLFRLLVAVRTNLGTDNFAVPVVEIGA